MNNIELDHLEHPFSAGLKPEHLQILSAMAMPVTVESDELIFREGQIANRLYLLLSGRVAVVAADERGFSSPIQTLGSGDVLGWSWIVASERWAFSARALEPCEAIFLYGTKLRNAGEQDPAFGYIILKRITEVLVARLQATRKLLMDRKKYLVEL